MCGRYTLTRDELRFAERLRLAERPPILPRYNIAPTQDAPIVLRDDSGMRMKLLRWGLIPRWAKDPSIGSRMINARAESVAQKPAFRHVFRRQRCLVPADGFYEWMKLGRVKQPVRIVRKDGGVFAFAGLWDRWRAPEGIEIESFTVITTAANSLVAKVHDRMPVILPEQAWDQWLDTSVEADRLNEWLRPLEPELLEYYEVGLQVNNARYDAPDCIERVGKAQTDQEMLALSFET